MFQEIEREDNVETFQTDVSIVQLTSWILKNFYPHKEVFLRELISNSIDALNTIYCDINVCNRKELCINIVLNKNDRTLTIFDNGIGMSKTEMIRNFGVITKSYTKLMSEKSIGQFGIGFYSVYLVADKVTVTSKCRNDDQYLWESSSNQFYLESIFNIRCDRSESLGRGTKIVLHIKNDYSEYLEKSNIEEIIKKYFQFSKYPISVLGQKEYEKKLNEDETKKQEKMKKKMKKRSIDTYSEKYNVLDTIESIFTKSTIMWNQYFEFYKLIWKTDWISDITLGVKRFSVKNPFTFKCLLYIPMSMFYPKIRAKKKNEIKLYVKRVFIMGNCEELIPNYLNFVQGIVYSDDLPLNISRDRVQHSKILNFIRDNIEINCLKYLDCISIKSEIYFSESFFQVLGKNIKLGIYEDSVYHDKLTQLLRYYTSASGNKACSLKDYVSRMKENQRYIYFITGESIKQIENSVFLEAFKMRDIEVIYMTDPIDEFIAQKIKSFDKKPLISVASDHLVLPGDDNSKEKYCDKFYKLCEIIYAILKDQEPIEISVSNRLVKSPCCVMSSRNGWTANMERIAKIPQILYDIPILTIINSKKQFENIDSTKQFKINLDHAIFQYFLTKVDSDYFNNGAIKNIIILLYETALISSGFILKRPDLYATRIYQMIQNCLDIK